jgi:hypothetical protein
MTVKELIEKLQEVQEDAEIIVKADDYWTVAIAIIYNKERNEVEII